MPRFTTFVIYTACFAIGHLHWRPITGENRIQCVIDRTGIRRFTEMADRQLLPSETIQYVPAVLNLMMRYTLKHARHDERRPRSGAERRRARCPGIRSVHDDIQ